MQGGELVQSGVNEGISSNLDAYLDGFVKYFTDSDFFILFRTLKFGLKIDRFLFKSLLELL